MQAILWWVPPICWAGVIYFMSTGTFGGSFSAWLLSQILSLVHVHVSADTLASLDFGFRKLAHTTEYAILALFLYHAISKDHRSVWQPKKALLCVLLAGLYSLTDEFHQRFVPGRGPSIVDSGIDTMGALIGMIILYFARERPSQPQEETEEVSPARNRGQ